MWREDLLRIMETAGYRRFPSLRRSNREDSLFATDYPQAAEEPSVRLFICKAKNAGWHIVSDNGWLHLDRTAVIEAADFPPIQTDQSACCLSMLYRNRFPILSDGTAERMILKALEEGTEAYNTACKKLHSAWAVSLRNHTGIPAVDPEFFGKGK